jgi:hypothetical protein
VADRWSSLSRHTLAHNINSGRSFSLRAGRGGNEAISWLSHDRATSQQLAYKNCAETKYQRYCQVHFDLQSHPE